MDIYRLSFESLLGMCEGHIPVKVGQKKVKIRYAFQGGDYLGSPGKDIFFSLPQLTEEQMHTLAKKHCSQYPIKPPGNHVGIAACVRYIYGQFEKQGILRSKADHRRMEEEDIDWVLPRKFIQLMKEIFEAQEHYYGLTILAEMEAHRLGDEAILNKDNDKLAEMEQTYLFSATCAHKCQSFKQMFTPYYWAAKYFMLADVKDKAWEYSKKTIKAAEAHCPDARKSYSEKLVDCANFMKKHDKRRWRKFRDKISSRAKNRAVKKMFAKV
tara:strand:+ start:138 stop:944 length:807 start_codon:yes stop_codon:yes gene_type:complete